MLGEIFCILKAKWYTFRWWFVSGTIQSGSRLLLNPDTEDSLNWEKQLFIKILPLYWFLDPLHAPKEASSLENIKLFKLDFFHILIFLKSGAGSEKISWGICFFISAINFFFWYFPKICENNWIYLLPETWFYLWSHIDYLSIKSSLPKLVPRTAPNITVYCTVHPKHEHHLVPKQWAHHL
jgi:hypothetical protein